MTLPLPPYGPYVELGVSHAASDVLKLEKANIVGVGSKRHSSYWKP
jgi:hypothetical protein